MCVQLAMFFAQMRVVGMFKLHFDCGAVFLLPFGCILLHVGDVSCTHSADVSASDRCRLFMLEFDCGAVLCCRSFVSLLHWSTSFQLQSSEVHVEVISVLFDARAIMSLVPDFNSMLPFVLLLCCIEQSAR